MILFFIAALNLFNLKKSKEPFIINKAKKKEILRFREGLRFFILFEYKIKTQNYE